MVQASFGAMAATLVAIEGERVTLRSATASAPGARLAGTLAGGQRIELKVLGCRRDGEEFTLQTRLVNATRALREHLQTALPA